MKSCFFSSLTSKLIPVSIRLGPSTYLLTLEYYKVNSLLKISLFYCFYTCRASCFEGDNGFGKLIVSVLSSIFI